MIASLLLMLAPAPAVQDLGEGRYRATTVYRGRSLRTQVEAQMRLSTMAERHCRGRGEAVIEALEVNPGPRRNEHSLAAAFICRSR